MIISVIGNFLVILNITCCIVCFEDFKIKQSRCYFENGDYKPDNYETGHKCMKEWVENM
jgi:hypothetical protein